jgi:hypothetical protein
MLTRISLPIEVVLRVAVTLQIKSGLLASWAMSEWNVVVGNIVEEMNFFLLQHKTSSNRMNWRIAPTFVEKSSIFIELLEVVRVSL